MNKCSGRTEKSIECKNKGTREIGCHSSFGESCLTTHEQFFHGCPNCSMPIICVYCFSFCPTSSNECWFPFRQVCDIILLKALTKVESLSNGRQFFPTFIRLFLCFKHVGLCQNRLNTSSNF